MGIGAGTALGAALVDNSKGSAADGDRLTLSDRRRVLVAETNTLQARAAVDVAAAASLPVKQAELAQLDGKLAALPPANAAMSSRGLADLLADRDGYSLHRVQMAVFTVVLQVLFWASVGHRLLIPEFDNTLLALMGISSGTYLGFKLPEKA
jgi:hypothetical protein